MLTIQSFRDGFLAEFTAHPRFFLEIYFGFSAAVFSLLAGFALGVPGAREQKFFMRLSIGSFFIWALFFVMNFIQPDLQPSMLGKRETCLFEGLTYGLLLSLGFIAMNWSCLLYTSPSPRDATLSRMPSSA